MKKIGSKIAEARKRKGLTQEELGGLMDLSFQTVSSWERGETVPDLKNLIRLREILGVSLDSLTSETDSGWELNNPNYNEDHMYTYLKAKAQEISLPQTLAALPFMKEKHAGYFRVGSFNTPYSAHPLTMACHALAMGIRDDDVLAACLLHDVVEDTGTKPDELPVSNRVREAVCLVSYNTYDGPKEEIKDLYYRNIGTNPLAALVKCIDRCNNLSVMSDGFTREKMATYVRSTEKYVLPLLDVIKAVPEYNNAAWLLRYQIITLLETCKRLLG